VLARLPVPVGPAGASVESTGDPIFEEAPSTSITGTVMPILRQYGFLIAGAVMVLGTVSFLVVYSRINPRPADA